MVLVYGRLFGGATRLGPLLRLIRGLRRRQAAWTAAAGLCIAVGYLCYFATRGVVPRAVAYAFGCIPMLRLEPQTNRWARAESGTQAVRHASRQAAVCVRVLHVRQQDGRRARHRRGTCCATGGCRARGRHPVDARLKIRHV